MIENDLAVKDSRMVKWFKQIFGSDEELLFSLNREVIYGEGSDSVHMVTFFIE